VLSLSRIKQLALKWGVKSGVSIVDQAVFSGSSFLLSLLLARWLSPGEYGTYAIAFSIFLFIAGFHNALILDPMYVLGSSRHTEDFRQYVSSLMWLHFALTLAAGLVLAVSALFIRRSAPTLSSSLAGLAITCPFTLLFWLMRSACYVRTRPDLSLRGGALYAICLFGVVILLFIRKTLSPFSVFTAMALASTAASAVLMAVLGVRPRDMAWPAVSPLIRPLIRENWGYGKWIVGSAFVYWLSGAVYVPLVGTLAGLDEAGAFQAMQNLLRPLQQSLTALNTLFLPFISRQRRERGDAYLKKTIPTIVIVSTLVSVAYFIFLLLAQRWLIPVLYKNSFYIGFADLLPYLWIATLLSAVTQGLVIGLKTLERTELLFKGQAIGALFTMTVGLYLVYAFKVRGAALGSVFTMLLLCVAYCIFLLRYFRKSS